MPSPAPSDPANPPQPIDPITLSKIESLRRKQRADAFLQTLTDEESNQLFSWFIEFDDICDVFDRVTAPPPKGLGREVSTTSLRRLRSHFRALTTIHATRGILDTITDMELEADLTQSTRIQHAISHMLHEQAFEIARTHPGSATMRDLLASIRSLAELDFKRQKLLADHKKNRPQPAPTQHHRVDLNIVPPARTPVVVQTEPHPDQSASIQPQLAPQSDDAAGGRT